MLEWGTVVKKQVLRTVGVGFCLLLGLSACREIEGVDYLNIGHPADPTAPAGKTAKMSRALISENINVRPDLEALGSVRTGPKTKPAAVDHSMMNHGSH